MTRFRTAVHFMRQETNLWGLKLHSSNNRRWIKSNEAIPSWFFNSMFGMHVATHSWFPLCGWFIETWSSSYLEVTENHLDLRLLKMWLKQLIQDWETLKQSLTPKCVRLAVILRWILHKSEIKVLSAQQFEDKAAKMVPLHAFTSPSYLRTAGLFLRSHFPRGEGILDAVAIGAMQDVRH